MPDLHPTAAAGFDAAAADYDRFRPDYPAAAVDLLTRDVPLSSGRVVADLGAGTGKLTRHLVSTGADVIAVEPVTAMRRVLRASLPDIAVIDGTAEAIPLPDGALDAVTAAQAFHWFDAGAALREGRRVLRSGGTFAIVFNRRDLDTPVQAAVDELLVPFRGDTPSWADDSWRGTVSAPHGFAAPVWSQFPNRQDVDLEGLRGRVGSVSFVATLDADDRAVLDRQLGELFEREQRDGRVTLAYRTEVWLLRRDG